MQRSFIISGGGTGGHIFPALSIAAALERRFDNPKIHFVGAKGRMEMDKVPEAGYSISGLWISGIDRSLSLRNLMFPFKLLSSLWKAYWIINRVKPQVVIGTGGFASGPTVFMASKMGIPTLIQEQNSYPGITNRWLASKVQKICVAYDKLDRFFPDEKIVFTGNPVRKDLASGEAFREECREKYGIPKDSVAVLVLGGSLGSKAINGFIANELNWFVENDVHLLWQTGKLYEEECVAKAKVLKAKQIKVQAFVKDMPKAYAMADIVISRAGAGTLSELTLAAKASILIPSPNVAEDHQTKNAESLMEQDAAVLIKEGEMQLRLLPVLKDLVENLEKRKSLEKNITKLAKPESDDRIVDEIEKIIG